MTWTDLAGYTSNSLATSFIVTSGVTAGASYYFRVRAMNIYGYGSFSNATLIVASGVPS